MTELANENNVMQSTVESVGMQKVKMSSSLSIDSVSKLVAIIVVLIYISGFLITSLHTFHYGFSAMNAVRPRILAAGGWFAIWAGVPFLIAREIKRNWYEDKESKIYVKIAASCLCLFLAALLCALVAPSIFKLDLPAHPFNVFWWQYVLILLSYTLAILFILYVIQSIMERIKIKPTGSGIVSVIIFLSIFFVSLALFESVRSKMFTGLALLIWTFIVGGISFIEMIRRDKFRTILDFSITITLCIGALVAFGVIYYPHIMAKWGGGQLIPIELTIMRDSTNYGGEQINCSLIDETDAGFYVISDGEKFATFIPRTAVAAIHYSQGDKHILFQKQQPQQQIQQEQQPKTSRPSIVHP